MAALGGHRCFREASAEKRAALLRYAGRAVRLGAPFDEGALDGLIALTPAQVDEAAASLPGKASDAARAAVAAAGPPGGKRTWAHDAVDRLFGGIETIVEPFLPDAPDLWARIDDAAAAHNEAVETGTAEGRYAEWRMHRRPGDNSRMRLERTEPETAKIQVRDGVATHEALAGIRRWDLAEDLQMSAARQRPSRPPTRDYERCLASRERHCLDAVDPGALRVVHSRSAGLFAEASTDQRWDSCLQEDKKQFVDVPTHRGRGGVICYLVDRDDEGVRYPLLRVILVPGGDAAGSHPGRYKPLDVQGSTYGSEATVARFREAAVTLARRLNAETPEPARHPVERPGEDAYRLAQAVDRVIGAHRRGSRSIREQVELARDLNAANKLWKNGANKALLADVSLAWTQYEAATAAVDRLATVRQGWRVAKLIDGLRERAFELTPGAVAHRGDGARNAVHIALEEALADQDLAAVNLPWDEREALVDALAALPERGDVVAAALHLRVGDYRPPAGTPFDWARSIWRVVEEVQEQRWKHLQEVAEVLRSRRDDVHNRAAETERNLAKTSAAADMDRAFEVWRDLTWEVSHAFGWDAWKRVRAAALRDGLEQTLERLCGRYMWPLTTGAAFSLVLGSAGTERRQRVRGKAAEAARDVPRAWEEACRRFEASPWSRDLRNPQDVLLELFGVYGGNSPYAKPEGALGDLWHEHDQRHAFYDLDEKRTRQRSFLAKVLLPDECKALKRAMEVALEAYHVARRQAEDPRSMPEWVGATRIDALTYCWLSDPARFRMERTASVREARNRVDAEEVAGRAHRLIRFEEVIDIPGLARLVGAAAERLAAQFPDFWKVPRPRRTEDQTDAPQTPVPEPSGGEG